MCPTNCNDCGRDYGIRPSTCTCGATTCWQCYGEYHSRGPRTGCAAFAGKKLVEDIKKQEAKEMAAMTEVDLIRAILGMGMDASTLHTDKAMRDEAGQMALDARAAFNRMVVHLDSLKNDLANVTAQRNHAWKLLDYAEEAKKS